MIGMQISKVRALLTWLAILAQHVAAQDRLAEVPDSMKAGKIEILEELLGPTVKEVVATGMGAISAASPLFCPITSSSILNYADEPQMFFFNNRREPSKFVRINNQDAITKEIVRLAQFDPNQMTYIFIHGCVGGIDHNIFLTAGKNTVFGLRPNGTCPANDCPAQRKTPRSARNFRPNVIIVDWHKFAGKQLYMAGRNTAVVAERLARKLRELVKVADLKPELMHCIGHSYGSHVCGQTARYAFPGADKKRSSRMGRVTGLDPGGFCYDLGVDNEATYTGLKPSDALLVDAFYTNRGVIGAKYDLAQYNIVVNDGVNQPACSLKDGEGKHEKPAYVGDSILTLMGNFADAQTSGCDHFFCTLFTYQELPPVCNYVSYVCDSQVNFLRGRCGFCSNEHQCYAVNLEYQRQDASIEHYAEDVKFHSSYYNDFVLDRKPPAGRLLNGSVSLGYRRSYFMRTSDYEPYCSISYRVRVHLRDNVDLASISKFILQFVDARGQIMNVTSAIKGASVTELELYGPWKENGAFGLDERTMTSLFDLNPATAEKLLSVTDISHVQGSPIKQVIAYYDKDKLPSTPSGNPIGGIALDYIGSSDHFVRQKLSVWFDQGQFRWQE